MDFNSRLTFKQFLEEEDREIHAKQFDIDQVPYWDPSLGEGDYRVDEVVFSAKHGLGAVPFNQSVYYHGFIGMMKPSVFATLALPDPQSGMRSMDIARLIVKGYALGIPFLTVKLDPTGDVGDIVRVMGHEGRARMEAIKAATGDEPVPVHMLLSGGLRARHLDAAAIKKIKGGLMSEDNSTFVMHPYTQLYVEGRAV
jgi:hypothetical protein